MDKAYQRILIDRFGAMKSLRVYIRATTYRTANKVSIDPSQPPHLDMRRAFQFTHGHCCGPRWLNVYDDLSLSRVLSLLLSPVENV
jgi:hypothetical protein